MTVRPEKEKEESSLKPENLTDLPVPEEQARETKGGTVVTDYAILECRFRDSTAK